MAMPTAEEIICLYLYGQETPPEDLKTESLIRDTDNSGATYYLNKNEFMTTGGGRFVKVENFKYVRNFLGANDAEYIKTNLQPGIYTRDELIEIYQIGSGKLDGSQYYLGIDDPDYMDRAYVFGSMKFEINKDAKFIINSDGSREVLDIAVVPVDDNFDYISTSTSAQVTNWLTKERIDPSGIGRTVQIKFTGDVADKQSYTDEDWYALDIANKLDKLGYWAGMTNLTAAPLDFAALYWRILQSGIIDYKDSEGRFVYYDGKSPINDGNLIGVDGISKVQLRGTIYDGSVVLIGGGGNDKLTGFILADELYGGDGNDILDGKKGADRLEGGEGFDKYFVDNQDTIMDSDGSGSVTLYDMKLGVATRKKGETEYRDKRGNVFLYDEANKHLTVNGGLQIENYSNGDLGIILDEESDDPGNPGNPGNPNDPIEPIRDGMGQAAGIPSPIMLDLDGDGVETTSMGNGIYFDYAADGFAEKTAWVGKDDGLLVRDLTCRSMKW